MTDLSTQVQLWVKHLDLPSEQVQDLEGTLAADEKIKAQRFRFAEHRRRFIVARARLREILGHYLNLEPHQVVFEYSPKGKPFLCPSLGAKQLQFNLSHSHELAFYGFAQARKIGVDLEYVRSIKDFESLAQRFFCPSESTTLGRLPPLEKEKAFFQIWTAKEAYLKAIGEGIGGGLDRVEISLTTDATPNPLRIVGDNRLAEQWCLWSPSLKQDYVATVAVEQADRALSFQLIDSSS
jgi:4'-phosphopantetheinyl transferase